MSKSFSENYNKLLNKQIKRKKREKKIDWLDKVGYKILRLILSPIIGVYDIKEKHKKNKKEKFIITIQNYNDSQVKELLDIIVPYIMTQVKGSIDGFVIEKGYSSDFADICVEYNHFYCSSLINILPKKIKKISDKLKYVPDLYKFICEKYKIEGYTKYFIKSFDDAGNIRKMLGWTYTPPYSEHHPMLVFVNDKMNKFIAKE